MLTRATRPDGSAAISYALPCRVLHSVIIHDLDVVSVPFAPGKADPPTVIDPNTVLPGAIALQRLQPVAADGAQISQTCRGVQPPQPFPGLLLDTQNFRLPNPS